MVLAAKDCLSIILMKASGGCLMLSNVFDSEAFTDRYRLRQAPYIGPLKIVLIMTLRDCLVHIIFLKGGVCTMNMMRNSGSKPSFGSPPKVPSRRFYICMMIIYGSIIMGFLIFMG